MPTSTSDLSIMERSFSETDSTSLRSADSGTNPSALKESKNFRMGSILASSAGSKLRATKATIFSAVVLGTTAMGDLSLDMNE